MAKNKNKKKKNKKDYREKYFENKLVTEWEILKEDMEKMSKKLKKADAKAARARILAEEEASNKGKVVFHTPTNAQIKVRKNIIQLFKDSNFLESIAYIISNSKSFVKVIAKLFCVLVVTLFSVDNIKKLIPIKLLDKIDNLFNLAIAI